MRTTHDHHPDMRCMHGYDASGIIVRTEMVLKS